MSGASPALGHLIIPINIMYTISSHIYSSPPSNGRAKPPAPFPFPSNWPRFLLLSLLSLPIHKPDGGLRSQHYLSYQSSVFVGWRTEAPDQLRNPLILLQHSDHMRLEHCALQYTQETSDRHPSLHPTSRLDAHRPPRTRGPALLRNK